MRDCVRRYSVGELDKKWLSPNNEIHFQTIASHGLYMDGIVLLITTLNRMNGAEWFIGEYLATLSASSGP